MKTAQKRATVYFDPELHRALRLKALETERSVSDLVNEVIRVQLADSPCPPSCEKLSGQNRYRARQGNYRTLYTINDQDLTVCVVKDGYRKDVYR